MMGFRASDAAAAAGDGDGNGYSPSLHQGGNIIKNSPGQIVVDGAEPQWWLDTGNATLTDEDATGEGIPEKSERVWRVVTTSDDHHGYQTHTFADEPLLDAGQTVVSFGCWVYATSAIARIAISGTALGQVDSSTHTGDSTWQWLTVEDVTLDAADTAIHTRCIVNTGTAYFTMPMLNVGPVVRPWAARDLQYVPSFTRPQQISAPATGDIPWSDSDCTANTDALAVRIQWMARVIEVDGTTGSFLSIGHASSLVSGDYDVLIANNIVFNRTNYITGMTACDDSQIVRYKVEEIDADGDVNAAGWITGYWRWA